MSSLKVIASLLMVVSVAAVLNFAVSRHRLARVDALFKACVDKGGDVYLSVEGADVDFRCNNLNRR
jgi:hypothetical protein